MLFEQKEKDVLRGKDQGKAIWPFSISASDDDDVGDSGDEGDESDDNGDDSKSSH